MKKICKKISKLLICYHAQTKCNIAHSIHLINNRNLHHECAPTTSLIWYPTYPLQICMVYHTSNVYQGSKRKTDVGGIGR